MKIISLGNEGEGVGSHEGLKIFVEGALPGEEVEVQIDVQKKNYAKASLLKIHTPSKHRVVPICPLFGECGGCQIMHLSYPEQLKAKQTKVAEALKRIGHLNDLIIEPCIPSPSQLAYRNKIQLPVLWEKDKLRVGLYKKNSHDIIPIEKCYIQNYEGEQILHEILPLIQDQAIRYVIIRTAFYSKEALVILVTDGTYQFPHFDLPKHVVGVVENINPSGRNVILGTKWKTLSGRDHLFETLLDKKFKISAGAFFQVNTEQAASLFEYGVKLCDLKGKKVIDAYCGVGTFSLFAASVAKSVIGIEAFPQAILDAKENAALNAIQNCQFLVGKSEELLKKLPTPDVLFLNPPRQGCEKEVLQTAIEKQIPTLLYISCDPATLARDLAILKEGHYQIETIQPFDMFPQTMHVETVVNLIRN